MLSDLARQQQAGMLAQQHAGAAQQQMMGSPWSIGFGGGAARVIPGTYLGGGVYSLSTIEKMQMDVDEWLKDWED